jgi:hypothetical protein
MKRRSIKEDRSLLKAEKSLSFHKKKLKKMKEFLIICLFVLSKHN